MKRNYCKYCYPTNFITKYLQQQLRMLITSLLRQINRKSINKIRKSITSQTRYFMTQISNQINFTPKFFNALQDKLSNKKIDSFLRLQIFAGEGCEGFTYKFKFDDKINQQKDYVKSQTFLNKQDKQQKRIIFAVDGQQIKLLRGATIDFSEQMMREVFYVKQNPNAQMECSCKVSFSPKQGII